MTPSSTLRRRGRHRLEVETPLIARAAAGAVVDEAARFLSTPLPPRYVTALACRARVFFAYSPSFRRWLRRAGDAPRDRLLAFMRHWLAARLQRDQPELFFRLPRDFAAGAELPAGPSPTAPSSSPVYLANDARLLLAI